MRTCNPSILEMGASTGVSVKSLIGVHGDLYASLTFLRSCLNKTKQNKQTNKQKSWSLAKIAL